MNLVSLAISILWLLIGIIILCAIIWLALYVIRMFVGIPPLVEKAVWLVVLILILIGVLSLLSGGGTGGFHFHLGAIPSLAIAAYPASAAANL
jgi:hypothetical protein